MPWMHPQEREERFALVMVVVVTHHNECGCDRCKGCHVSDDAINELRRMIVLDLCQVAKYRDRVGLAALRNVNEVTPYELVAILMLAFVRQVQVCCAQ